MSVYFTSDMHFGHKFASSIRGFSNVETHDALILDKLVNSLTSNDKLFVLGDVAFSQKALYANVPHIPGTKVLIRGNHDKLNVAHYLAAGFNDVIGAYPYKKFILTHIPIHEQEILRFRANIHGHIHKGGLTPNIEGKYYNVSVDFNNYLPVPFDYLSELFRMKE